jgi:hypothetical protein
MHTHTKCLSQTIEFGYSHYKTNSGRRRCSIEKQTGKSPVSCTATVIAYFSRVSDSTANISLQNASVFFASVLVRHLDIGFASSFTAMN